MRRNGLFLLGTGWFCACKGLRTGITGMVGGLVWRSSDGLTNMEFLMCSVCWPEIDRPDNWAANELSAMCGEYGVVATARGDSTGSHGRGAGIGAASTSSGWSENRLEMRRALIRPEEIIQDTRVDEAFVLVRGAGPLRCGRAIYFRRKDMAPLVAANRFRTRRDAAE